MFLSETEQKERKAHNQNINNIPDVLKTGFLPGDFLIIRLYCYEDDLIDENGIMIPRYKAYETEGGQPKASMDNPKYTTKAVILKVGDGEEAQKHNVGDEVYVPLRVSLPSSQYFFDLDRDKVVSDFAGVARIPAAIIEFNTRKNNISSKSINEKYATQAE